MGSTPATHRTKGGLQAFSRKRRRIAALLSAPLVLLYLAFVLLTAFEHNIMLTPLVPGVTIAILLGVLVIADVWVTTFLYVRWVSRSVNQRPDESGACGPTA
jgi:uncharacterized membrane protein (DUF485 family)